MTTKQGYYLIGAISFLATVGSLYFGYFWDPVANLANWQWFNRLNALAPCDLCWYMRVFQYPILLIALVAWWTNDTKAALRYIAPLALWGLIVWIYKQLLERSVIQESAVCVSSFVSCSDVQVEYFWRLGLPLLWIISLSITLIVALVIHKKSSHE